MKLTHICLAGTVTDGWSYQENMLLKYHKKLGLDVSLITSKWMYDTNGKLYKSENDLYDLNDGTHMYRLEIKNFDSINNRFKRYFGVYDILEKTNPDIIFIHGCQFLDIKEIVRYIRKHEVEVYVDNHADFSNSASNFLSKTFLHGIVWKYYSHLIEPYVTKFYGVLPARVDFLLDVYKLPREKVDLLVMGVDDDLSKIALKEDTKYKTKMKYDILNDKFLIITGGKIDRYKWQISLLIDAVHEIDNKNVELIIFGSIIDELKEAIIPRCYDNVKYIGWLNTEETYNLFAVADLAVFPGRHSVFWEQISGMGKPMVCKYWDGTTHVDLGGNVEFLYNDTKEEIKEKLLDIIDNPDTYEKMKTVAENKCKDYFSYEEISKKCISWNSRKRI